MKRLPRVFTKIVANRVGKRIVKAYLVVAPRNPPKERNTMESTEWRGIFFKG
tara:strand:+ start:145 stop:300 length:156 start_codon:yes stop_codon:yes gene_type:complete